MRKSPLKAILDVRRHELPFALSMFAYFLLVITSFWVLKPIKKSIFIQFYDESGFQLFDWQMTASQAELLAKVLNMAVAFVAVVVFTWLVRWFRRQHLTFIFTGFFLASYIAYTVTIDDPGAFTVWSFYLFGDLFSTLMVATFFAFLNDSVSPDGAKRLYGLIGFGGVTGGVIGTVFVSAFISSISASGWLWVCCGMGVLIVFVASFAGRCVPSGSVAGGDSSASGRESEKPAPKDDPKKKSASPAIEGAQLVFSSKYFLWIASTVGLYEIVSTVMDFQFTSTIAHYLDGPAIGQQFSTVFAITNVVAMVVQLFLTSFVMTRFGIGVALMVLPVVALAGSTAFMAMPILWFGSLLNTADNGFSYSMNQSAKEALYVPTTQDEKYKAKAFIDMFVQRFAKAIAVFVSLGITSEFSEFSRLRWLSLFTIVAIVLWILAARGAGRQFQEMTKERDS
ncbi:MAG: Npt1/Npt2 family nucleotide transporter [Planctomycetota bacterium]